MARQYLKRAEMTAASGEADVRETVERMLREIEVGGEAAALDYARKLDDWQGEAVVTPEEIAQAATRVPERLKEDIGYAHARVRDFAKAKLDSMTEFEIELAPGLFTGQRLIPVTTASCYVPGGRYAHVASVIMSVTTARVAGVENVIACSPPGRGGGVDPAILYTLDVAGADGVLALGGVQGIAALAFGLFGGRPADILVGPGNQYVSEAKRLLYGRVGIDLFAGPTEILVIADETADPKVVATDLVSQAEYGANSPAWLVTTSRELAEAVMALMLGLIDDLPDPNQGAARAAWADYGEVVLAETREEAAAASDGYAPEHLEVQAADPDWWLARLRNYGSLFLGAETTVTYGDKSSGPNHILPTKGAGCYTGGLGVGKFIKTVTYQRMSREANREVGVAAARISRLEGMEGHARSGDSRLAKYFPRKTLT